LGRLEKKDLKHLGEMKAKERNPFESLGMERWSWGWDSDPRPAVYETAALPTELPQPEVSNRGLLGSAKFIGNLAPSAETSSVWKILKFTYLISNRQYFPG
jgi:hypothetical protein